MYYVGVTDVLENQTTGNHLKTSQYFSANDL